MRGAAFDNATTRGMPVKGMAGTLWPIRVDHVSRFHFRQSETFCHSFAILLVMMGGYRQRWGWGHKKYRCGQQSLNGGENADDPYFGAQVVSRLVMQVRSILETPLLGGHGIVPRGKCYLLLPQVRAPARAPLAQRGMHCWVSQAPNAG